MSVTTERIVTVAFGPDVELDFALKIYRATEVSEDIDTPAAVEDRARRRVLWAARMDHLVHPPPTFTWDKDGTGNHRCTATVRGVTVDDIDLHDRAQAWVDAHAEELTDAP